MKKTFSIRFTDEQFYFLQEIAKHHQRTLEELIWLFIQHGHEYYAEMYDIRGSVPKRGNEFSDEEKKNLENSIYVEKYHDINKIEEVLESIQSNILEFRP